MDEGGGRDRDRGFFDPTRRFRGRAELYARHRPGYPGEVVTLLEDECGLRAGSVVADLGSGTGILAAMLLARGCRVFGVEPNADMRAEGARALAAQEGFVSVDGRAEATTLPDASVDLVTAAQAFHWFDRPRARAEFARILKPGGGSPCSGTSAARTPTRSPWRTSGCWSSTRRTTSGWTTPTSPTR